MIWLVVILTGWALLILLVCWANYRIHRLSAAEPVPYWPATTNPCTWCKPAPEGSCTCAGECGHVWCVGDHTTLSALSAADMRWLREQTIRGHE